MLELEEDEEEVEVAEGGVCGAREVDEPDEGKQLVEMELLVPFVADEEETEELEDRGV